MEFAVLHNYLLTEMEFNGKIIAVGTLQTGESPNGEWKRFEFVMEEVDVHYPRRISFRVKGSRAEEISSMLISSGTAGIWKAQFDINARAFIRDGAERWVNDIDCWKVERLEEGGV